MPGSRYSKLTDAQRETLRLFNEHLQIKQIAQVLGVSVSTVNNRLRQSRKILGQGSSRGAARWMFEHEETLRGCTKSASSFSAMANPTALDPDGQVGMSENDQGTGDAVCVEAAETPIEIDLQAPTEKRSFPWPFPTASRRENDLGWKIRLALVFPVAIILMICAMTLVVLGIGFQELLVGSEAWVIRLP